MESVAPEYEVITSSVVDKWSMKSPKIIKSNMLFVETDRVSASVEEPGDFNVTWKPKDKRKAWTVLYEMVWQHLQGRLVSSDLMKAINTCKKCFALESLVTDVLWYIETQVTQAESEEEKQLSKEWKTLCSLVTLFGKEGLVRKELLFERLGLKLLEGAGFLKASVMHKKLVRGNTNRFFRQRKYNLLGEESEGFSKLITELQNLQPDNISSSIRNMLSLIGYFHLDPNRVFDIILEQFEHDPANPAYLQLLCQRSLFRVTNVTHLLGFKFQMYHPSNEYISAEKLEDSECYTQTPFSLYRLTAMLIALDNIEIKAIFPHLYPPNEVFIEEYKQYILDLEKRAKSIGAISLSMRSDKERKEDESAKMLEERLTVERRRRRAQCNQKFGVAAALLSINAWDDALNFIETLQKIAGKEVVLDNPLIRSHLINFIDRRVDPLYKEVSQELLKVVQQQNSINDADVSEGIVKQLNHKYKPPLTSFEDFIPSIGPMLVLCGHRLSHCVPLFEKTIRIIEHILNNRKEIVQTDASKDSKERANRNLLLRIINNSLLASLPLIPFPDPSLVHNLWQILAEFDCKTRFDLYERWYSNITSLNLQLVYANVKATHDAKQVLKRMAKERELMRLAGRSFAKVAHNSPISAFSALLSNIQVYDNLIPIFVDSIKFCGSLSLDVLAYLLIINLARDDAKLKDDGTSYSHWLQSLCKFTGYFYARYPHVELVGILNYLLRQLKQNKSLDLLLLKEITAKMTGLEVVQDFSDSSLRAMGGSNNLRNRARAALGATASQKKRAISRLKHVLVEEGFMIPLILKIAQQRNLALIKTPNEKHLKLIGHTYDESTSVLVQFIEFVQNSVDVETYKSMLPKLVDLCQKFHIEQVIAFHIARPIIRYEQINLRNVQARMEEIDKEIKPMENNESKDESMRLIQEKRQVATEEANDIREREWSTNSAKMVRSVNTTFPSDNFIWKCVSPKLYCRFWSHSLYDIFVPRTEYNNEMMRLETRISSLRKEDDKTLSKKKRELEIQRNSSMLESLKEDLQEQLENQRHVLQMIKQEKHEYFPKTDIKAHEVTWEFISKFLLPRVLFSAEDALYCAKFVKLMHDLNVPGFSTYNLLNRTADIMSNLFCTTETEAQNLGVYLHEILQYCVKWGKDRNTYAKECGSFLGFCKDSRERSDKLQYGEFVAMIENMFENLTRLFVRALKSNNYMQIRPALLICSKIDSSYPSTIESAEELKNCVQALEKEDRQDIKIMSKRYLSMLTIKLKSGNLKEKPKAKLLTTKVRTLKRQLEDKATVKSKRPAIEAKKQLSNAIGEEDGEIKDGGATKKVEDGLVPRIASKRSRETKLEEKQHSPPIDTKDSDEMSTKKRKLADKNGATLPTNNHAVKTKISRFSDRSKKDEEEPNKAKDNAAETSQKKDEDDTKRNAHVEGKNNEKNEPGKKNQTQTSDKPNQQGAKENSQEKFKEAKKEEPIPDINSITVKRKSKFLPKARQGRMVSEGQSSDYGSMEDKRNGSSSGRQEQRSSEAYGRTSQEERRAERSDRSDRPTAKSRLRGKSSERAHQRDDRASANRNEERQTSRQTGRTQERQAQTRDRLDERRGDRATNERRDERDRADRRETPTRRPTRRYPPPYSSGNRQSRR